MNLLDKVRIEYIEISRQTRIQEREEQETLYKYYPVERMVIDMNITFKKQTGGAAWKSRRNRSEYRGDNFNRFTH